MTSPSNLSSQITLNPIALTSSGLLGAGGASGTLAAKGAVSAGDRLVIAGTTYTFVAGPLVGAAKSGATATAVNVVLDTSTNPVTNLQNTLANLAAAINGGAGAGTVYQAGGGANANATASASGNTVSLAATQTGQAVIAGGGTLASTVTTGVEFGFLNGATFSAAAGTDLLTSTAAQAALVNINSAIQAVAGERGAIGAVVNRLQSASNVISNEVQNLTAAQNGITAADIPSAVANLTKYSILEQTGISALAQANQQQQLVLKLLQ